MNPERPCEACVYHTDRGQPWCGAYDMPSSVATTHPMLCGPTAEDFVRRPKPESWADSWKLIALVLLLAAIIALLGWTALPIGGAP